MGYLRRALDWLLGGSTSRFDDAEDDGPESTKDMEAEDTQEGAVRVVPIEESIDLHHFAPRDVASVVDEYLRAARSKGFTEVRVIHGRGKGIQRQRVQKQLARHPAVLRFRSDGLGSTLVELRARRRPR